MTGTEGFNAADIIALIAIVIGLVAGFRQGLSGQMTMVLTALGIGFALVKGLEPCKAWLLNHTSIPAQSVGFAAGVVLVVIPMLLGSLLYILLRHILKITFTTWFDRIGGAIAGAITAAGIVLLVFILLNNAPAEKRPRMIGNESWIEREIIGGESQLVQRISTRIEAGEDLIKKAREEEAGKREQQVE